MGWRNRSSSAGKTCALSWSVGCAIWRTACRRCRKNSGTSLKVTISDAQPLKISRQNPGVHSLSLLVPQALMGVATVCSTYDLTRLRFGRAAGFAAGLALALTPVMVAISRHNNLDALLVLCVTAALWCLVRGLQDGRTRWIVLCGVCVGLGFEAKMAAALSRCPRSRPRGCMPRRSSGASRLRRLAAGAAAALAAGGAWPVLVALTPAADRPWVSGTTTTASGR